MEEDRISFEVAKLAKEKGYLLDDDKNALTVYENSNKVSLKSISKKHYPQYIELYFKDKAFENYYCFPTQNLLRLWLIKKHGIHVEVTFDVWYTETYFLDVLIKGKKEFHYEKSGIPTEKEALDIGLIEALNLIEITGND